MHFAVMFNAGLSRERKDNVTKASRVIVTYIPEGANVAAMLQREMQQALSVSGIVVADASPATEIMSRLCHESRNGMY